ncbi:hypothetical protein VOLCADRAFT_90395 [Volvox carteri f. nagariensis]|uniref:Uncharacterized protein n=1 Tax=Volvox carteri f. nagariensis TaxID=3068 RepID=D8TU93_VOLCA|nr:uncharacterized protein VOLCADRAFT_90395 [Volvox carteri f. nagariensis]EFJ49105.1 hypothetical protein VOLCADRAFT_90395 [Volvox carteri f. nagariensis]|eukprot:XP_002950002.1 hypothetical protein VOLCADRAFT_90395 [Volvox carteri f. nagariensis]
MSMVDAAPRKSLASQASASAYVKIMRVHRNIGEDVHRTWSEGACGLPCCARAVMQCAPLVHTVLPVDVAVCGASAIRGGLGALFNHAFGATVRHVMYGGGQHEPFVPILFVVPLAFMTVVLLRRLGLALMSDTASRTFLKFGVAVGCRAVILLESVLHPAKESVYYKRYSKVVGMRSSVQISPDCRTVLLLLLLLCLLKVMKDEWPSRFVRLAEFCIIAWTAYIIELPVWHEALVSVSTAVLVLLMCGLFPHLMLPEVNPLNVMMQAIAAAAFAVGHAYYQQRRKALAEQRARAARSAAKAAAVAVSTEDATAAAVAEGDHGRLYEQQPEQQQQSAAAGGLPDIVRGTTATASSASTSAAAAVAPAADGAKLAVEQAATVAPAATGSAAATAASPVAALRRIQMLRSGGRSYISPARPCRFALKIQHSHLSDLPQNLLTVINQEVLAGSGWQAVGAYAREGCIELVLDLRPLVPVRTSHNRNRADDGAAGDDRLAQPDQDRPGGAAAPDGGDGGGGGGAAVPLDAASLRDLGRSIVSYLHSTGVIRPDSENSIVLQMGTETVVLAWQPDAQAWVVTELAAAGAAGPSRVAAAAASGAALPPPSPLPSPPTLLHVSPRVAERPGSGCARLHLKVLLAGPSEEDVLAGRGLVVRSAAGLLSYSVLKGNKGSGPSADVSYGTTPYLELHQNLVWSQPYYGSTGALRPGMLTVAADLLGVFCRGGSGGGAAAAAVAAAADRLIACVLTCNGGQGPAAAFTSLLDAVPSPPTNAGALHMAVAAGSRPMVELLVRWHERLYGRGGGDVKRNFWLARASCGVTPLHVAAAAPDGGAMAAWLLCKYDTAAAAWEDASVASYDGVTPAALVAQLGRSWRLRLRIRVSGVVRSVRRALTPPAQLARAGELLWGFSDPFLERQYVGSVSNHHQIAATSLVLYAVANALLPLLVLAKAVLYGSSETATALAALAFHVPHAAPLLAWICQPPLQQLLPPRPRPNLHSHQPLLFQSPSAPSGPSGAAALRGQQSGGGEAAAVAASWRRRRLRSAALLMMYCTCRAAAKAVVGLSLLWPFAAALQPFQAGGSSGGASSGGSSSWGIWRLYGGGDGGGAGGGGEGMFLARGGDIALEAVVRPLLEQVDFPKRVLLSLLDLPATWLLYRGVEEREKHIHRHHGGGGQDPTRVPELAGAPPGRLPLGPLERALLYQAVLLATTAAVAIGSRVRFLRAKEGDWAAWLRGEGATTAAAAAPLWASCGGGTGTGIGGTGGGFGRRFSRGGEGVVGKAAGRNPKKNFKDSTVCST